MAEVIEDVMIHRVPTNVEGSDNGDDLLITQAALDNINKVLAEGSIPKDYFLRFDSQSGGCSGMRYMLGFDNIIEENDREFDVEGLKIVISADSLFYYMGITLDYVTGPHGSGFVFNSPFDAPTCGCSH